MTQNGSSTERTTSTHSHIHSTCSYMFHNTPCVSRTRNFPSPSTHSPATNPTPWHPVRHPLFPPPPTFTRNPQPNIHPPNALQLQLVHKRLARHHRHETPPLNPSLLPPNPPQPPSPTTDKTDCRSLQTGAEKQSRSVRWRCCASLDGTLGCDGTPPAPDGVRTGRQVRPCLRPRHDGGWQQHPCIANKQTRVRVRTLRLIM